MMKPLATLHRRNAMTLIELLAVISLMIVLLALMRPALHGISGGMYLTQAADKLGDSIVLARQEAITKNKKMEIMFFKENGVYRGWQVFENVIESDGTVVKNPVSRKEHLPDSVSFNEDESDSPLLTDTGFAFRGNGRPDAIDATKNYITLYPGRFDTIHPNNYIILQVNPVTGRIQKYQP